MIGDAGFSLDEAGSGIEPPVAPRVRQAFGLLERFAPAVGARWALELWCTPPAVESSLRMPPGVSPGEPVEAVWSGHLIAGESWGDGPAVYLVHGWGGCRAHLGVFVKPLVEAGNRVIAFDLPSHNASDPGDLAPGRTTIVECAEAVGAFVRAHGSARAIVAHSLGAKAVALAVARGTPWNVWCFWRRWATSRCIWTSSLIVMASDRASAPGCIAASTEDWASRCSTPTSPGWRPVSTIRRRFWSCTTPTTLTAPTRRARELSAFGLARAW